MKNDDLKVISQQVNITSCSLKISQHLLIVPVWLPPIINSFTMYIYTTNFVKAEHPAGEKKVGLDQNFILFHKICKCNTDKGIWKRVRIIPCFG